MGRVPYLLFLALVATHGVLSVDAARKLSPTWDEIVYPAAGAAQLKTGAIELNTEHGYLSKLFYGIPLLALRATIPTDDASVKGDEHRFGFQVMYRNVVPAARLIFWSRMPALVFSIATLLLLFFWMRLRWGAWGGLLAGSSYCATPILQSRASLALLEAPMFFFGLLSLFLFVRSQETRRAGYLFGAGAALAGALVCKLPSLPILPCMLLALSWPPWTVPKLKQALTAALTICTTVLFTIGVLYMPWHGGFAALHATWQNLLAFDTILPYFWNGQLLPNVPSLVSWAAWLFKAPPAILLLGLCGFFQWREFRRDPMSRTLALLVVTTFGSVLFFHHAVTTIQFSLVYLAFAGFSAALVQVSDRLGRRALVVAMVLVGWADALRAHPNALAYFSPLLGGPRAGHRWVGDSDQDWGQSLGAMAAYSKSHGSPPALLAYSGAGDPRAAGLRFQDFMSPALFASSDRGKQIEDTAGPLLLYMSTKVLQSEPYARWIFTNSKLVTMPDPCFFVYDLSHDAEALRWATTVYAQTGRLSQARWALSRVQRLDPQNPWNRQMALLLESHR